MAFPRRTLGWRLAGKLAYVCSTPNVNVKTPADKIKRPTRLFWIFDVALIILVVLVTSRSCRYLYRAHNWFNQCDLCLSRGWHRVIAGSRCEGAGLIDDSTALVALTRLVALTARITFTTLISLAAGIAFTYARCGHYVHLRSLRS